MYRSHFAVFKEPINRLNYVHYYFIDYKQYQSIQQFKVDCEAVSAVRNFKNVVTKEAYHETAE